MIAFGAGVHFAVGGIDFELLLEWLVNKHKRRRVVGQTICSCNALIAFGAGVPFAVRCIDFELRLE